MPARARTCLLLWAALAACSSGDRTSPRAADAAVRCDAACPADSGSQTAAADSGALPPTAAARVMDAAERTAPDWSRALHQTACKPDVPAAEPAQPGKLVNVAQSAGVSESETWLCNETPLECEARSAAGGAAAADFDGDGWVDLYVVRGHSPDSLYLNCGAGHFVDVTAQLGISKADAPTAAAAWADVDSDGDLDLLVTSRGSDARRHYLYIQDAGQFSERGIDHGISLLDTGPLYGTSAAFGDYDRDGYLDLYLGEWRDDNLLDDPAAAPKHARLFHNRGAEAPGKFEDVTELAGLVLEGTTSNNVLIADGVFVFTPIFSDLDDDGWPDLALVSDYGASKLFWNRGDGTFVDGTRAAGVGTDQNGMGADIGDVDGDGRLDWFITSIYEPQRGWTGNRLYKNLGQRKLQDVSKDLGVRNSGWGWGAVLADLDLDGYLDIFSVSGFRLRLERNEDVEGRARLLQHPSGELSGTQPYREVTDSTLGSLIGQGRGVALLDFDRDGDRDLFVSYHQQPDALLRNDLASAPERVLTVRLIGKLNTAAIGARVTLTEPGKKHTVELHLGSGFMSQSDPSVQVALASAQTDASVEVRWPSGARSQLTLQPGHEWLVYEP